MTETRFSRESFETLQLQMSQRAQTQRGVRRSSDPAKYPLSTRVVDLTNGCGSIMYDATHPATKPKETVSTPYYKCGRNLNSKECFPNKVNGERLPGVCPDTYHQSALKVS
jgi:hypothetical protein